MKNTELFAAFGINSTAVTAPSAKITLKDRRQAVMNRLERMSTENPVTWEDFNRVLSEANWAVLPSKSVYTAAFGETKAKNIWLETETRWFALQAVSAVYVDELDSQTAETNSKRREYLFAYLRDTLSYHGITVDKTALSKGMLISIGNSAIKYNFGDDSPEARTLGITAFIKAVIWCVLGYDTKGEAIEALKAKAGRRASAVGAKLGANWDEAPYPASLTEREKAAIGWDGNSARKDLTERRRKALEAK